MFKTRNELLEIKDIKFDKEIYPRAGYNWMTALSYKNAMVVGDEFPPITVALYEGEFWLIDGKHRLEGNKLKKEKYIRAEILRGLNKQEMYLEAVKRNLRHGSQLSVQDRAKIIIRLQDFGYDIPKMSNFLRIPPKQIQAFKVGKITSTITGKEIPLKQEFKHYAGEVVPDNIDSIQEGFRSISPINLITELNTLISNRHINIKDKKVVEGLRILYKLLGKYKAIRKDEITITGENNGN